MDFHSIYKEQRIEVQSHLEETYRDIISKDVMLGLTSPQKSIPSKYFYDARGSKLFEKICHLPEYYPTRTEMSILQYAAPEIMRPFNKGDLVELGSGANWKIKMLLNAAGEHKLPNFRYVPVDVSKSALISAAEELLKIYPGLVVKGIVADFMTHFDSISSDRPRMILFLGSTIGNLDNKERSEFFKMVADSMNSGDRFLVGFDMIKPKEILETAYNDSQGVTSKFNKNVLHVLNRKLNADFDPSHFNHLAFFNKERERVEMHLKTNRRTEVNIEDLKMVVELDKGETIHTEICKKFSRAHIEQIVNESGMRIRQWFFDPKEWFSITELESQD